MKTLLLLILMLPGAVYAQPGKTKPKAADTQTTAADDAKTTRPNITPPAAIEAYKSKAAWAAETVITQADALKEFKASTRYRDIWTSPSALAEYEDAVTSFTNTLTAVQEGLLTTATEILTSSQYEIQAAKQMMKHRGDATY